MKKASLALAVLLALALTACGGSSGSSAQLSASEKKAATGIATYVTSQSNGLIAKKDASCFADKFVAKAGLPKLKKAKLLKADGTVNSSGAKFDKPLATTYVDTYFDCLNYADLEAGFLAKADPTLDKAKLAKCIGSKTNEADAKKLVVGSLIGKPDQALTAANTKVVSDCRTSAKGTTK
jgi:hypothetical protein